MCPSAQEHDSRDNVTQVQNLLGEKWGQKADEAMIQRCLRADRGNVEKCTQRIIKTLEWRQTMIPSPLVCRACAKDHTSHYLHQVGFDKIGRPVIYSVFNMATDMNPAENVQHMIHCFEHAISVMAPKLEQQQWVWVSDFSGFGMKNLNPSIALEANTLFGTYYPERLGAFILLGAPTIFSVLYSAISPALDPITSKKLAFIAKDSKITERLSEFFDDELVSWITTEVTQNNSKSTRKKKRYATPAIVGEPGFATAEEAPYLRKDAVVDGHNIHGTQSFLQFLQSQDLAWQQAYYHVAP
mmetsp:Transcript_15738/g.30350  ORF Transcript_15738/g.30350 Transcript_15738/m.30350 type:complete len:299 (-) Transcript_15738:17-913(-)